MTSEMRMRLIRGGLLVLAGCTGCVSEPYRAPDPEPPSVADTTVYFYPKRSQPVEQQDRDKYECHRWAVQQSGFDPSAPGTPPHLHLQAEVGPPAGAGIAVGAVTGAALGAAVSRPWEAGEGAVLGAVAGAIVGGIAESAAAEHARAQPAVDARRAEAARFEQQARNYRRAMSACLEGRGYEVR